MLSSRFPRVIVTDAGALPFRFRGDVGPLPLLNTVGSILTVDTRLGEESTGGIIRSPSLEEVPGEVWDSAGTCTSTVNGGSDKAVSISSVTVGLGRTGTEFSMFVPCI